MRKYLADLAHRFADGATKNAEETKHADIKRMWHARSLYWSDVEQWLEGLKPWEALRTERHRRLGRVS